MLWKFFIGSIFILKGSFLLGQDRDKIKSPVRFPIKLSGTFGELRGNHFHTGIDIKTKKKIGVPILAAADGYVYRVRVSPYGYGKVLYMRHDNGLRTVYAHLSKFNARIETRLKERQYKRKKHFLTMSLSGKGLRVSRGKVIGYSGNTGSSQAPHLHFEVRDSKGAFLNPLNYDLPVKDRVKPRVKGLFLIPLEENRKRYIQVPLPRKSGWIHIKNRIYIYSGRAYGIGLEMIDRQTGSNNGNGVYGVTLYINGKQAFSFRMDTLEYVHRKLIRLHTGYSYLRKYGKKVQKCFVDRGNRMPIYGASETPPRISLQEGQTVNIKAVVFDIHGNKSIVKFSLVGKKILPKDEQRIKPPATREYSSYANHMVTVSPEYLQEISKRNLKVRFPKHSLAAETPISITSSGDRFDIGNAEIPLLKNYTITFEPIDVGFPLFKWVICRVGADTVPLRTTIRGGALSVRTDKMGAFVLLPDTTAPRIIPVNIRKDQWMSHIKKMHFKIRDDLSGIGKIEGYIDSVWMRFEYDPKKALITYDFEDLPLTDGKHTLKLKITDRAQNQSVWQTTFYRVKLKRVRSRRTSS